MDETDLRLIQILMHDPRAPYRDLADGLGLSVQAVHRRLQNLIESKVVTGFFTGISLRYLGGMKVLYLGKSTKGSREDVVASLGKGDRVSIAFFGSGGTYYIEGVLRRLEELEPLTAFVREAAGLGDLTLGIEVDLGPEAPFRDDVPALTPLDRRIVAALQRDCRRPLAEVAEQLNVSVSTVKRRLDRMVEQGAVQFSLGLHPGFSGDVVAMLRLTLSEGLNKRKLVQDLRNRHGIRLDAFRAFANLPDLLICAAWVGSLRDLELLADELGKTSGIKEVVPDIIFGGVGFPTWLDRMSADPGA